MVRPDGRIGRVRTGLTLDDLGDFLGRPELPNRASLQPVPDGMTVLVGQLVARVPISWLPFLLAAAVAACQQKGSGPGY